MIDVSELQRAVLTAAVRLSDARLTVGTYGNVSARAGARFVITPSGADRRRLSPSDMPVVHFVTGAWTGPKPSSERALHRAIYLARGEVGAVIHAHAPNACTVAAALRELPSSTDEMRAVIGPSVRVAAHALTGTKRLEAGTLAAIEGRRAALLANHGAVCVGRDLDDAFACLDALERGCRAYIDAAFARAADHTGPVDADAIRACWLRVHSA